MSDGPCHDLDARSSPWLVRSVRAFDAEGYETDLVTPTESD